MEESKIAGGHPVPCLGPEAKAAVSPAAVRNDLSHGATEDKFRSVAAILGKLKQDAIRNTG